MIYLTNSYLYGSLFSNCVILAYTICQLPPNKEKQMELFEKETDNRDYVLEKIQEKYMDEYKIGKEIPVPYRQIYIPKGKDTELEIWCFKQDICIYKTLYEKSDKTREVSINYNDDKTIKIKLQNINDNSDVALPLLIIETKMAEKVTTHELLAYSEKVQMIKTLFPYCKYILLLFGKTPKRAYLHGLNFDRIMGIAELSDNEIKHLHKIINDELFEVKESIDNIK
jgi:hypothetical protein